MKPDRSDDASTDARELAEGREPDDVERDPVQDELATDPTLPDPEDELMEREDTHYTTLEDSDE